MDAKAKIAEMLQRKRQGESNSSTPTLSQPVQQKVAPTVKSSPPQTITKSDSNPVTALDRINALLRQRQQTNSSAPITNSSAANNTATMQNENQANAEIPAVTEQFNRCPFCLGKLVLNHGLFHCDKCQRRLIKPNNNEYLDISELPFGICDCCQMKAPLIKLPGTLFPQCANSKETYIPAAGQVVRLRTLPFGLCRCCNKPEILVATNDQTIRCPNSGTEYLRNIDGTIVLKPPVVDIPNANDIEAALNDGHAAFYYGGFIGGQEQNSRRRRRR